LTNSERAVVKGGVDCRCRYYETFASHCCLLRCRFGSQCAGQRHAGHNNPSRDGVYIDPGFTPGNAANLTRDLNFDGTIVGNVYAQPLYVESGPNGPMVIAVTESNNVYALNAMTGTVIWQRNIGTPAPTGACPGNISPNGITGTPVVDLGSRSLFFDSVINGKSDQTFYLFA
jgi:hypothetical protein